MPALPPALDKVATLLSRLPGVGKRSGLRWAFHILGEPPSYARELQKSLGELLEHVRFCRDCHHLADNDLCDICRDPVREGTLLCVVEGVPDLLALERTGSYRGRYHVLHGALAPLKGIGPSQLRLDNLEDRIATQQVSEVILATSADVEGEATALYLAKRLAGSGVDISRIATGIPMGGELEYLDDHTLSRAITGRTRFS
jgi:recombination protein RecR